MVKWFIEMNFSTLIIIVYMSVFLLINSIFPKKIILPQVNGIIIMGENYDNI